MKRIRDKYIATTLDQQTVAWIKDILSNDDVSTDEELMTHFMEEGRVPLDEAKLWVSRRGFYLTNIVLTAEK
jgi:hypothetical protein